MLKHLQNICKNVLVFYFTCNHGLSSYSNFVSKVHRFRTIPACDGQTSGQTRRCRKDPGTTRIMFYRAKHVVLARCRYRCQQLEGLNAFYGDSGFSLTASPSPNPHCQCVSIFISFHAIILFEVARSQPAKPAGKQNFTRNSQSRSFKVIHFGITEKPTTDCVSLYDNAGLISKVSEEIASENTKNCRCRQPYYIVRRFLSRKPS